MAKVSRFKDVISVARGQEPEQEPKVLPVDEVKPSAKAQVKPDKSKVKSQAKTQAKPEAKPQAKSEVKPGKVKPPGRTEVKQQAEEIKQNFSKRGGKSSNNDYKQSTIYVRKDLHKKVIRLLEDDDYPGDFSDWVEEMMLNLILQTQQQAEAED